jgi:hypothetical protein
VDVFGSVFWPPTKPATRIRRPCLSKTRTKKIFNAFLVKRITESEEEENQSMVLTTFKRICATVDS